MDTTNEQLIRLAYEKKIVLHLVLKDGSWKNGTVEEITPDFFIFSDKVRGKAPIFFLELGKVSPYVRGGK